MTEEEKKESIVVLSNEDVEKVVESCRVEPVKEVDHQVKWDGDDEEYMRNIPEWRKWVIVGVLSFSTIEV
jgi:hypothetical protein